MAIRSFCMSSYRVSTQAMNEALQQGDLVLVNKLPVKSNPARNRIVLFESPLQQDAGAPPLFLSRCIGMPGDTMLVSADGYSVNGREIPLPPEALAGYFVTYKAAPALLEAMRHLQISTRNWSEETGGYQCALTPFEAFKLREELTPEQREQFSRRQTAAYQLVVPRKGRAYRLDEAALTACRDIIMQQAGDKAEIINHKLYIDGVETDYLFFDQDYYWLLSDNIDDSVDSRHLGFIPADHLIGTVMCCWFSPNRQRIFKPV